MDRWLVAIRRLRSLTFLVTVCIVTIACGLVGQESPSSPAPSPTPELKSSSEAAEAFLRLWGERRYDEMYDIMSTTAQTSISRQDFVDRYRAIGEEATITGVRYELTASPDPNTTPLPYTVHVTTLSFGEIEERGNMELIKESNGWRVEWSPALIFRGLTDSNFVHLFSQSPRRGTISDRNGVALATDARVWVVGVVPESIENIDSLVATLAQKLSMTADDVRSRIDLTLPAYYFLPIKTLPPDTADTMVTELHEIPGVTVREQRQRFYPYGDLAAHMLGYMTEVSAEQLETLRDKGYREGDRIGAAGLEGTYEAQLAGLKGGTLAIVTSEGTVARVIAEKTPTPGKDITTTIDVNVQKLSEDLLGQKKGSVVALDPNNNGILAMASYPRFDPNAFIRGLSASEWEALNSNSALPFLNRATQASYPPGSTFKVVTTAAGLERGGYSTSSRFPCPPVWYGLGEAFAKNNWQSVDRGALTLSEGLMASCNPVFYEVALNLDNQDPNILPSIASSLGLGQPTGVNGIDEAAGLVPTPEWKRENLGEVWFSGDSVNMGIGQGFLLVTPIQTANMYSTIVNSGLVRKPLLVTKIASPAGETVEEFSAEEVRRLEFASSTWAAIREGLTLVVASPGGTAYNTFVGSRVPIAGKSGTAEDIVFQDHVFFVGYAPREAPQAVVIVALEEGESGSREAGPIVRSILESYATSGGVRQLSD